MRSEALAGRLMFTSHALTRIQARGIGREDISAALARNGKIFPGHPSQGEGDRDRWKVGVQTQDGREFQLVLAIPEDAHSITVITVFTPDVTEQVASEEIDAKLVRQRVEDWANRIEDLYKKVASWLPEGWAVERQRTVRMDEQLMKDAGVPARDLPSLDILRAGENQGFLEPRGLWIVGANGRLDLVLGGKQYVIVDAADSFDEPEWKFAPIASRASLSDLTGDAFRALLQS